MSLIQEFKSFAMRGNVIDMAVGIIIGAACGKVVSSFVDNIVMPPLGLAIGGVDFSDLAVVLREAQGDLAAVTLGYGAFIQSIVDFLIIAAAIFVAIKDRKSTRLNSSHVKISYAVFCLKKKRHGHVGER